MTRVIVTQGFLDDFAEVKTDKLRAAIVHTVELLEVIPDMGSRDLPASIRREFDDQARKIPVGPFDIITWYDEGASTVTVFKPIHQKAAW